MDGSQFVVAALASFLGQVKNLLLALPNMVTGAESFLHCSCYWSHAYCLYAHVDYFFILAVGQSWKYT